MCKKGWKLILFTLVLILSACGESNDSDKDVDNQTGSKSESKELVVVDWGGVFTEAHIEAIYKPFEEEFGVKITAVSPPDYGKFKVMVTSGNVEWDVVSVSADYTIQAGREGLLEELDYDVIDTGGIPDDFVREHGVGADTFTSLIAYNTNAFSEENHPSNWIDMWNTDDFPGQRTFMNSPYILESALLADGVKQEELFPLDVERAFKSLDKIKDGVKVWWTAGAQPPELLSTGEVDIAYAWNGRVASAKAEGAPVDLVYNDGIVGTNDWVIPKGAPNKDLAMEFINFAIQAEQQAEFSKIADYGPTNLDAVDLLSDDDLVRLGLTPEDLETRIVRDEEWWGDNYEQISERLNKWLLE